MKTSRGIAALSALAMAITGAVAMAAPARAAVSTLPVLSEAQVIGDLSPNLVKDDIAAVSLQLRMVCSSGAGCDPVALFDRQIYLDVQNATGTPGAPRRWVEDSGYDNGSPNFVRVSGTASDGVYKASAVFTSSQNGSYVFGRIGFAGLGWGYIPLGASGRTVVVKGSDPLILRPQIDPGAVRPGTSTPTTVAYLVQTANSGHARPGADVWVCIDPCGDLGVNSPKKALVTNGIGQTPWFRLSSRGGAGYASLIRTFDIDSTPQNFRVDTESVYPTTQSSPSATWINIKASVATINAGQAMTLSGSVGGNGSPTRANTVIVQRWVGGQWSTLGRALPLVNGRWSYVTVPRSTGVNQYRVIKPTNACSGNVCLSPNATSGTLRVTVR